MEAHICVGSHCYKNTEKQIDTIKKVWTEKCVSAEREHKVLVRSTDATDNECSQVQGWALKSSISVKRFTVEVKDYLFQIYMGFEATRKRPNYDDLADDLKTKRDEEGNKYFSSEEWLSSA